MPDDRSTRPPSPGEPADEAIRRLLDLYAGQVYSLGLRFCGDRTEAEDLVQEVFLQAFRGWDSFEGRSSAKTWLYTIAARACQRMHRPRAGEPAHLGSLDELLPFGEPRIAAIPSDEPEAVQGQIRREARERIEQAIASLPTEFRVPLILKEIVGFSAPEVAGILGMEDGQEPRPPRASAAASGARPGHPAPRGRGRAAGVLQAGLPRPPRRQAGRARPGGAVQQRGDLRSMPLRLRLARPGPGGLPRSGAWRHSGRAPRAPRARDRRGARRLTGCRPAPHSFRGPPSSGFGPKRGVSADGDSREDPGTVPTGRVSQMMRARHRAAGPPRRTPHVHADDLRREARPGRVPGRLPADGGGDRHRPGARRGSVHPSRGGARSPARRGGGDAHPRGLRLRRSRTGRARRGQGVRLGHGRRGLEVPVARQEAGRRRLRPPAPARRRHLHDRRHRAARDPHAGAHTRAHLLRRHRPGRRGDRRGTSCSSAISGARTSSRAPRASPARWSPRPVGCTAASTG